MKKGEGGNSHSGCLEQMEPWKVKNFTGDGGQGRESFRFQWDRGCELVIPTMSTQRGGTYVERKAEVEIGDIGGHFHHP